MVRRRALRGLLLTGVLALPVISLAWPSVSGTAPTDPHCPATAAQQHGWGAPVSASDFGGGAPTEDWLLYDAVGHAGHGRRTPAAISVADGILTITGDAAGDSGGMAWSPGRQYGRWEVCARSPGGSPNYHPVLLLWPDSDRWPADGEIDFMEIWDPTRQQVTATMHHLDPAEPTATWGPSDHAQIRVDATQWHSWAVDWAPDRVVGYVDGVQWFELTQHVPSAAMHLCIQLDNFGGDVDQGGLMMVDWAKSYPLR